ncbi:MAG: valine--tRNA ligase [Firmicutes bacterium]|nr:valine--tRNA ligase [Bacillota bacterium]
MATKQLAPAYDPAQVEDRIYKFWEDGGYFHAEPDKGKEPFVIVMPPPNITGTLHIGHALMSTIEDVLVRMRRMQGYNTEWWPGTDHASIATEAKVVASLAKEGKTKAELGREEFLKRCWEWKDNYGGAIVNQQKKLGCSADWERSRFTMDEVCSRAVREVFVRLYEEGLIYRGHRMVNWCTGCNTSISDIEVEHEEEDGNLYYIDYPLEDGKGFLTIATTRPETMLGDTAVAVHPEDERYKGMVGRRVKLPIMGRSIPVIADEYVEREFGTGALKVTPSHDVNDYELGKKHGLESVQVVGQDGLMTAEAGKYEGRKAEDCRRAVLDELKELGLLRKTEVLRHAVGHCQRCGTTVEPLPSMQWFVKMEPLARPAVEVVKSELVKFVPDRFTKTYLNWMENCRDWCISRQLWWGHRIPVWYCQACGSVTASREDIDRCPHCAGPVVQDEDVLDTWFSSALWPFSIMGWPEKTKELEHWYPGTVLETGYDIIFFWVARMIFSGLKFMNEKPFSYVLLHGLVRNADGSKMSRSKGAGADPLDIISKYGADALRMSIISGNTPGNDIRWNPDKVEASRNFANKVWNASRFVLMNLEDFDPSEAVAETLPLELADRWMLSRLAFTSAEVQRFVDRFEIGEAARVVQDFIWGEFCDWYIEAAKPRLYGKEGAKARKAAQRTIWQGLDGSLRLLHPFMPFITEEIWQMLPGSSGALIISGLPACEAGLRDAEAESSMAFLMDAIRTIRNIKAEFAVASNKKVDAVFQGLAPDLEKVWANSGLIRTLAGVEGIKLIGPEEQKPSKAAAGVVSGLGIFLPLEGMIDISKEIERLEKELAGIEKELASVSSKLANESFVSRAPQAVVDRERTKLDELRSAEAKLKSRIEELR